MRRAYNEIHGGPIGPQKVRFLVSARIGIFHFLFFFPYETMPNCNQNCWID